MQLSLLWQSWRGQLPGISFIPPALARHPRCFEAEMEVLGSVTVSVRGVKQFQKPARSHYQSANCKKCRFIFESYQYLSMWQDWNWFQIRGLSYPHSSGLQCCCELKCRWKKMKKLWRKKWNVVLATTVPRWSWINKAQDVHIEIAFLLSVIRHCWKQNLWNNSARITIFTGGKQAVLGEHGGVWQSHQQSLL